MQVPHCITCTTKRVDEGEEIEIRKRQAVIGQDVLYICETYCYVTAVYTYDFQLIIGLTQFL